MDYLINNFALDIKSYDSMRAIKLLRQWSYMVARIKIAFKII